MLLDQIQSDLNSALKDKDSVRVGALRLVISEARNAEIDLRTSGKSLDDEVVTKVLQKEAKKRKEAFEIYEKANRIDLADQEKAELAVIESYLPKKASENEIKSVVQAVLSVHKDAPFGVLMKEAMSKLGASADGKVVAEIVKGSLVS